MEGVNQIAAMVGSDSDLYARDAHSTVLSVTLCQLAINARLAIIYFKTSAMLSALRHTLMNK
jgi:hypothetical protein